MLKSRSALAGYRAPAADGSCDLRLEEVADARLLHIGVYPGGAAGVAAGVHKALGAALPDSSVRATCAAGPARNGPRQLPTSPALRCEPPGDPLLMRIAPDQYWVLNGEVGLEARLRSAIPDDAGCVTSLDGARTRLLIEGPAARALLSRLVALDLDPTVFPLYGFAQTPIHHVAGLLFRAGADRYEFLALRTFAAFTWEVLLDAARSFGCEIILPEA